MNQSGESIRVVHPLFQEEGGGSSPTSPLQLHIAQIDRARFAQLNFAWHSRLPNTTNCFEGVFFGAEFAGNFYAVAWWSKPVARGLNGRNWFELRRLAIADDAPKNTASRMIRVMRLSIAKSFPEIVKLISYQDTDVHTGCIYKASGWCVGGIKKNLGTGWQTRNRPVMQSAADKIRWEYSLV